MEILLGNAAAYDTVPPAAELLSAEERLRLATEAADIGWWDVEEGHGHLTWPPRVKAMFGISPDAPVSMEDFYSGLHPEDRDRVAAVYAGAADPARRTLYDVEYRTIGKEDGVIRWVAAKGRGVFDESGQCKRMIGTAIDITERKRAQEEKLARQLEEAELRDQFIAVLGHDLRNPLASVAAGTRFLVRHPERAAEVAEQMEQSISRMTELIENILDFARGRLGGGFVTTRDSEKPLEPVLLQVIDELRGVHPEQAVATDIDLREPVQCDRQRVGQLLSNLLGNAFVYGRLPRLFRCVPGRKAASLSYPSPILEQRLSHLTSNGSSSRFSVARFAAAAKVSVWASISVPKSPRHIGERSAYHRKVERPPSLCGCPRKHSEVTGWTLRQVCGHARDGFRMPARHKGCPNRRASVRKPSRWRI